MESEIHREVLGKSTHIKILEVADAKVTALTSKRQDVGNFSWSQYERP